MKVCWNITSKCNLNCKHCFREKQEHDLPLEQNLRIIDNIANIVDEISFSGGEVLLYDCFDQVLQKANDLGIPCTFTTTANSLKTVDYNKYLKYIDVLVDGKFIEELSQDAPQYVGSTNQRFIFLNQGKITEVRNEF